MLKIELKDIDWIKSVEDIFNINMYDNLKNKGSISHAMAIQKAESEYDKYKIIQDKKYVSDFDRLVKETELIEEKK